MANWSGLDIAQVLIREEELITSTEELSCVHMEMCKTFGSLCDDYLISATQGREHISVCWVSHEPFEAFMEVSAVNPRSVTIRDHVKDMLDYPLGELSAEQSLTILISSEKD